MSGIFYRDLYNEIKASCTSNPVTFVLGPRKCGKTVALTQLAQTVENTEYIDFKRLTKDQSMQMISDICNDIYANRHRIYLLDEATHIFMPEQEIMRVADAYSKIKAEGRFGSNVSVVFTGSESLALSSWATRAFAGNASFIKADFLTYPEWLRFKGRNDISIESYRDYCIGTRDFYRDFDSVEAYLKGCLDETVYSNTVTTDYFHGPDVSEINPQDLIDILYLTLFSLHDHVTVDTFYRNGRFSDELNYLSKSILQKNPDCTEDIADAIASSWLSSFDSVKAKDKYVTAQSLAFLMRIGLISGTPVFDNLNTDINILGCLEKGNYRNKTEIFQMADYTINYPMFYGEIVRDIFGGKTEDVLEKRLLGSIAECNLRGILPTENIFSYHDENDKEIDHINRKTSFAIEISIFNKRLRDTNFDILPENFQKILLTKDISEKRNGIYMIPYSRLLYEVSLNKDSLYNKYLFSRLINDIITEDNKKSKTDTLFKELDERGICLNNFQKEHLKNALDDDFSFEEEIKAVINEETSDSGLKDFIETLKDIFPEKDDFLSEEFLKRTED